jgi:hypothetical protein
MLEKVAAAISAVCLGELAMSKQTKRQHDLRAKREAARTNADGARTAGEVLCRQAIADAKTLGPGSITQANMQRAQWGLTTGGNLFPSSAVAPTVRDLGAFVVALGLDIPSYSARAARFAPGRPIADFMALAESVKDRRFEKRLPKALSAARARTWGPPVELSPGAFEALEEMRYDKPRVALKATYAALKTVSGPSAVGRVLAVHSCALRGCDDLAVALLSLWVALPILDVVGDAWGMGRALTSATATAQACGEFDLARKLVDEAEAWHLRAGSLSGRGSSMALRGSLILAVGGDPRAALCDLNASLRLLPAGVRWRVAGVQQIKASALTECGDLANARKAIFAAMATAPDLAMLRGRIAWHSADIETEVGNHAAAEALYTQAYRLISEPLCDRLLLAAQAVRAAMRQGEAARAISMAKALLGPMFEPLCNRSDPMRRTLAAAHRDLYRAALEAGLSPEIVDNVVVKISASRTANRKRLQHQVTSRWK